MNKDSKSAIAHLNKLLLEINNISNVQQGNTWKAKLKDSLDLYLGNSSSLSIRLEALYFTRLVTEIVPGVIGLFEDHVFDPSKKENFRDLINNAISHIEGNGVSKSVKINFLGGFSNTEIISGIVIACGIVFGTGKYLGNLEKDREIIEYENKIKSLKSENKKIKTENEVNNIKLLESK